MRMRLQFVKKFFIFTVMIATTHIATANDLSPTANWSHSEGSATTFMAGTYVIFDGSLSHDNDENGSSITYYKWYVDGVLEKSCSSCSSFGWTFALDTGNTQQSVTIKLRVRDDEYNWDSRTITYTVRQQPGRTYYVKDHLGNVRVTVDENGNAIGYDDYYPFGKVMPGRSSNNANPNDLYKYTGHERDSEAGLDLDYMQARNYDPEIGRFLQVDPLADDPMQIDKSPYAYTWNNPVNLTDPDGRCPSCVFGALIGAAIDVGVQMVVEEKSVSELDKGSILISALAGATGAGLASKGKVLIDLAVDAGSSVASQINEDNSVSLTETVVDVTIGKGAGKLGDNVGDFVEGVAKQSDKAKILARTADRKQRIANQNSRPGRQKQAKKAQEEFEKVGKGRAVAASTSASGIGSAAFKEGQKKIEERISDKDNNN